MPHITSRRIRIVLAVVTGCALGVLVDRFAFAQQPAGGITRTILGRRDVPQGVQYETVLGIAEIAPGASSGKHRHPGFEIAYVLDGALTVEHEGHPTKAYRPGDHMFNDAVHNAKNSGTRPVKVLAVYVVEKGKPLAEPVP